jgi:nucleotide sugar dehydrogenase
MNKDLKIGIIGLGYVGTAVKSAYSNFFTEIVEIDSDPKKRTQGTYQDLADCRAVFVCVSSPQKSDGGCDTGPLLAVMEKLRDHRGLIISKTTAPPDTYQRLQEQFPNLVHAPEFLTAANSIEDYLKGKFCIIGGCQEKYLSEARIVIRIGQPYLEHVHYCSIAEAALIKYTINTFLSTKVIFMNEMATLAQKSGCDWDRVRAGFMLDRRIGTSHSQVPGPDGEPGFGGACFPKDTAALLNYARSIGVDLSVLDSAVVKNNSIRLTEPK